MNKKETATNHSKVALKLCLFLLYLPSFLFSQNIRDNFGALIRSDTSEKVIYLCFTGHDFDEGFDHVSKILDEHKIKASFFLTGDFVRSHKELTKKLHKKGHFVGAHSDKHLLYCDWVKRDSLLHTEKVISEDIKKNLDVLNKLGIEAKYFMPPYEWYNDKVVEIALRHQQISVNFTPGTRSNADYTTPDMPNYVSNDEILNSIYQEEEKNGFNGFHLLIHPGTNPKRKEKLYFELANIITYFKNKGYSFAPFF